MGCHHYRASMHARLSARLGLYSHPVAAPLRAGLIQALGRINPLRKPTMPLRRLLCRRQTIADFRRDHGLRSPAFRRVYPMALSSVAPHGRRYLRSTNRRSRRVCRPCHHQPAVGSRPRHRRPSGVLLLHASAPDTNQTQSSR